MENRVVAKLMRLEMTADLRKLLDGMPVRLQETTKTDCVYLGTGTVDGFEGIEVIVRVFLEGRKLMASIIVESEEVLLAPFGTEEEQRSFPPAATRAILSRLN